MRSSNSLEGKILSGIYWKDQLLCLKVQTHSSLEPLEFNRCQSVLKRLVVIFVNNLRVTGILCSCRLVLEGKAGKEIPDSLRVELLEQISANNLVLSNKENNSSRSFSRAGIEYLPLLKKLLAICQKLWQPSFWERILFYFTSIRKSDNFRNSFAMVTRLFELPVKCRKLILLKQNKRKELHEVWQQPKLFKTMELNKPWLNVYNKEYIRQFQTTTKLTNDLRNRSNQNEISHKLCDGKDISFWVKNCQNMINITKWYERKGKLTIWMWSYEIL